jgi:hypothetical protein
MKLPARRGFRQAFTVKPSPCNAPDHAGNAVGRRAIQPKTVVLAENDRPQSIPATRGKRVAIGFKT